eukprot:16438600-Heterocapsa_arctica.AAC.1
MALTRPLGAHTVSPSRKGRHATRRRAQARLVAKPHWVRTSPLKGGEFRLGQALPHGPSQIDVKLALRCPGHGQDEQAVNKPLGAE